MVIFNLFSNKKKKKILKKKEINKIYKIKNFIFFWDFIKYKIQNEKIEKKK